MTSEEHHITSPDGKSVAIVKCGHLMGYTPSGSREIMNGENGAWRRGDDEMFPWVGATENLGYNIDTYEGVGRLGQHGIARCLPWQVEEYTSNSIALVKRYRAGSAVENPRFSDKSELERMSWPYSFNLKKEVTLGNTNLNVKFELETTPGMPFNFGYHPAFSVSSKDARIIYAAGGNRIPSEAYVADLVGKGAEFLKGVRTISFIDGHGTASGTKPILIESSGFNNFMLWSNDKDMICIEPVVSLPEESYKQRFPAGAFISSGVNSFGFSIRQLDS